MAAQDYGILVTAPGKDVTTASGGSILMNTTYPFIKIDTQNPAGFQTILLLITTDPPEPVSGTGFADTYTVVYKFKHGYTYVPTVETLFVVTAAAPGQSANSYQAYFYDFGVLATSTSGIAGGAYLYAVADATWVYYVVCKYDQDGVSTTLLTGTNVQITSHVFVDDIGV